MASIKYFGIENTENPQFAEIEVADASTTIKKDGSNNLELTDAVTGTKTLAQLAAGGGSAPERVLGYVRASTTANITLSGAQTIDGVSCVAGDDVAVRHQSTGTQNGIYTVDASTWSRRSDMAATASVSGALFDVAEGTVYGGHKLVCTNAKGSDVVDADVLVITSTEIHTNTPGEIAGVTEKTAPVADDWFLIEDSESSNAKKGVKLNNIINSGVGPWTVSSTYTAFGNARNDDSTPNAHFSAYGDSAALSSDAASNIDAFGSSALKAWNSGNGSMSVMGAFAGTSALSGGGGCSIVGTYALTAASNLTGAAVLGTLAGTTTTTAASNCVLIGYSAGRFQTSVSNKLYIDSLGRTDIAGEDSKSMITGEFNATVASQWLRFNLGELRIPEGLVIESVEAGITASTTQSQGQQPLTDMINEISTVANEDDTCTMMTAQEGLRISVINNGANTMQLFPASGDNIDGTGVDTAITIAAGSALLLVAYDATNWALG